MTEMTEADRKAFERCLSDRDETMSRYEMAEYVWQSALTHARGKQEPVAREWRIVDDRGNAAEWMPVGLGPRATWEDLIDRNPGRYKIEERSLYTSPPIESEELARLRAENERLRTALSFYGDVHKYPAPFTGGMGALWSDCGEIARSALAVSPAPDDSKPRVTVPDGQTPLNDELGHPLLDVFKEGVRARDAGTASPYHGHSLEHCIHAAGWVQQDLRIALNEAKEVTSANRMQPNPDAIWNEAIEATTVLFADDFVCDAIRLLKRPQGDSNRIPLGTRVRKTKGSSWQGRIVGTYSTNLTPEGYAVESEREPGSVQIYPRSALEVVNGQK